MEIPESLIDQLLTEWPVARLATVTPEGGPHAIPIVFCVVDGLIYSPLDGKRKRSARLQRFANVEAHPAVTLLLDHYANDWSQLWWVRIDAHAQRITAEPDLDQQLVTELRTKYPQYAHTPTRREGPVYLRLQPTNVTAWSQAGTPTPIETTLARLR